MAEDYAPRDSASPGEGGVAVALAPFRLRAPAMLYRAPWPRLAAVQTADSIEATFAAAVEAVKSAPDARTARWVMEELRRTLPEEPNGVPVTAAIAALLDSRTIGEGYVTTFARTTPQQRREVLASMVADPDGEVRVVAHQLTRLCGADHEISVVLVRSSAEAGG